MTSQIWLNDQLVDSEKALVSVFDHGFTVGDGAFETLKVVDKNPVALTRHIERLAYSLKTIGIDFEKEMAGGFETPLQSAFELQYQKEECLSCPNFHICNGCYKTVKDLKKSNQVEHSCKQMKSFRQRAKENALC